MLSLWPSNTFSSISICFSFRNIHFQAIEFDCDFFFPVSLDETLGLDLLASHPASHSSLRRSPASRPSPRRPLPSRSVRSHLLSYHFDCVTPRSSTLVVHHGPTKSKFLTRCQLTGLWHSDPAVLLSPATPGLHHIWEGLSCRGFVKALGFPEGTVKCHLQDYLPSPRVFKTPSYSLWLGVDGPQNPTYHVSCTLVLPMPSSQRFGFLSVWFLWGFGKGSVLCVLEAYRLQGLWKPPLALYQSVPKHTTDGQWVFVGLNY